MLKTIEEQEQLDVMKMRLMVRALNLDSADSKAVADFNQDFKQFEQILLGEVEPKKVEIEGEADFKEAFSRFKDRKGNPKPLTMKVGKGNRSAKFSGLSVSDYFEKIKKDGK